MWAFKEYNIVMKNKSRILDNISLFNFSILKICSNIIKILIENKTSKICYNYMSNYKKI